MTVIPTFGCDDCGEEFNNDLINSYQVRVPDRDDGAAFEPPMKLRVDICDNCIDYSPEAVEYVAWTDGKAVGVRYGLNPLEGDTYYMYEERASMALGARWDRFFEQLDRVIENEWALDPWEVVIDD